MGVYDSECEDLDDDAAGLHGRGEPRLTRLWMYDPAANSWDHVVWELAPLPALASGRLVRGDVVLQSGHYWRLFN